MRILAITNIKGGVGKTTTSVNLSFLSAAGGSPTVLWDLDPQGAATFTLRCEQGESVSAKKLVSGKRELPELVVHTAYEGLDLLPSDFSYRNFDVHLAKRKHPTERLLRMSRALGIEIPQHGRTAARRAQERQVDRRGRLADAALDVRDGQDPHRPACSARHFGAGATLLAPTSSIGNESVAPALSYLSQLATRDVQRGQGSFRRWTEISAGGGAGRRHRRSGPPQAAAGVVSPRGGRVHSGVPDHRRFAR